MKLSRFVGRPKLYGPPIFLNSMPKAGTNLMENLLVSMGYKRNFSRCLNEHNISSVKINPRKGRFYIGHLFEDDIIHTSVFYTIYLKRDLWSCLKSYINYMYIDNKHVISKYLRESPNLETVRTIFLTNNNPNGRSLVDEYIRFYNLNSERYNLCIDFNDLIARDSKLVDKIAGEFGVSEKYVMKHMNHACKAKSYTKNAGKINLFDRFEENEVEALKCDVSVAESDYRYITK